VALLAGRKARRRRESVGADSFVFRLEAAADTAKAPSGANFFSCGESSGFGVVTDAKTPAAGTRACAPAGKHLKIGFGENPHDIGVFAPRTNNRAKSRAEKYFPREIRAAIAVRGRQKGGGAALTHKIKRSHCYFFSAVVIGW
jgi:hypothetical protein